MHWKISARTRVHLSGREQATGSWISPPTLEKETKEERKGKREDPQFQGGRLKPCDPRGHRSNINYVSTGVNTYRETRNKSNKVVPLPMNKATTSAPPAKSCISGGPSPCQGVMRKSPAQMGPVCTMKRRKRVLD